MDGTINPTISRFALYNFLNSDEFISFDLTPVFGFLPGFKGVCTKTTANGKDRRFLRVEKYMLQYVY